MKKEREIANAGRVKTDLGERKLKKGWQPSNFKLRREKSNDSEKGRCKVVMKIAENEKKIKDNTPRAGSRTGRRRRVMVISAQQKGEKSPSSE